MKKMLLALLLAVVCTGANAQFEKKTKYLNASLTGLDMNYSKETKFGFGLEATAGYFVQDSWMLDARVGLNHQVLDGPNLTNFEVGAGFRYYFKSCGIFLGSGLLYEVNNAPKEFSTTTTTTTGGVTTIITTTLRYGRRTNNISFPVEVGYCFYLNHFMSLEPSVYYNVCLNDFKDASRIGLRLGLGFYF